VELLDFLVTDVSDAFWQGLMVPLVVLLALYFTIRLGVVQVRLVPEMFRSLLSKPEAAPDGKKAISAFQAFAVAAAARVGTGNIVGVAGAITLGGPGAVLWMWLMAVLVASAAFVEASLAQLYKVRDRTGYRGGPAYYMVFGLGDRWMGAIFAVVLIGVYSLVFTSVQSNSLSGAVGTSIGAITGTPTPTIVTVAIALLLASLVALVIFGGIRRIAHVAQLTVPFMAAIYLVLGLLVVALNLEEVVPVLTDIVTHAFGIREVAAGGVGTAIMLGVQRGMFSNEAGLGSAPNAAATAAVSHPTKQGLVQALGVYFDTLLICSITAFIVLVSGPDFGKDLGAVATQSALQDSLGTWALHVLTVILVLLSFTTVLANYYYGESNLRFLSSRPAAVGIFRGGVVIVVFLGAVGSAALVWALADLLMGVMALVNLLAITPMLSRAALLLRDYTAQRRAGRDPVFTRDRLPQLTGVQVWDPPPEPR
jgi:alanine or glycine:cation symporter, AGCS family